MGTGGGDTAAAAARARTIALAVHRLLDGGRAPDLRSARTVLAELAPTASEWAPHLSALAELARGDDGPSIGLAQRALHTLDDQGLVPLPVLLEASASILRRPEKGTARSTLVRLAIVARRDALTTGDLATVLLTAAAAFDHPALDVAERALRITEDAVDAVDGVDGVPDGVPDGVRAHLATLARAIDPALRGRAERVLGAGGAIGTGTDRAPTVPRVRWPVRDADPSAVVDLLQGRLHSLVDWESALAAVVHLQATDPGALRDAVRSVTGRTVGGGAEARTIVRRLVRTVRGTGGGGGAPGALGAALAFLGRLVRGDDDGTTSAQVGGDHARPDSTLPHLARLGEVARLLVSQPVPLLLATPSHSDGSIEPEVLSDRLARAAREDWQPWPLDLEQALLRVTVPPDPGHLREAVAAARTLGTPAADRLAHWLVEGGVADPRLTVVRVVPESAPRSARTPRSWFAARVESPARAPGPDGLTAALLHPTATGDLAGRSRSVAPTGDVGWLELVPLPHQLELQAAWLLPHVSAHRAAVLGRPEITLTSHDGRVGPVTGAVLGHLLLGAPPARDTAVTVALHLSGRGQPWGVFAGTTLAEIGATPGEVLQRAVGPLRAIAGGGGAGEALILLVTALPALAAARPRGLPDLLALTSSLVVEHGLPEHAGPSLPAALDAIDDGDSLTAREARRLCDLLAQTTTNDPQGA